MLNWLRGRTNARRQNHRRLVRAGFGLSSCQGNRLSGSMSSFMLKSDCPQLSAAPPPATRITPRSTWVAATALALRNSAPTHLARQVLETSADLVERAPSRPCPSGRRTSRGKAPTPCAPGIHKRPTSCAPRRHIRPRRPCAPCAASRGCALPPAQQLSQSALRLVAGMVPDGTGGCLDRNWLGIETERLSLPDL
jgi:hypothetical protein